ncbi:hypothetical protein ACU42Y_20265 [Proteus mirabilis]
MQQDIFTMGVDIGSSASKCIIMKNGDTIVAKSLASVGAGTSGPEKQSMKYYINLVAISVNQLDLCNRIWP